VNFLISYVQTLNYNPDSAVEAEGVKNEVNRADYKGKKAMLNFEPTTRGKNEELTSCTGQSGWKPPPGGWLKTNVDASFVAETGVAAVGAVIRDHHGKTIVAAGKVLTHCRNTEEAEAIALTEGARLAASWIRSLMIFESDCKQIVDEVTHAEGSLSCWRSTIHDSISLASTQPNWKCTFAKRSQNHVAHEVAAYVRKYGVDSIWNNSFPFNVHSAMDSDCNSDPMIMK
jgi:hypothetical protein